MRSTPEEIRSIQDKCDIYEILDKIDQGPDESNRKPDYEAIRRLDSKRVGKKLGIIDQKVENPNRDRWSFVREERYTALQFFENGTFQNHKVGEGGTAIDLLRQWLAAEEHDRDYHPFDDNRLASRAASIIAEAFDLWSDYRDFRKKAQILQKYQTKDHEGDHNSQLYIPKPREMHSGFEWPGKDDNGQPIAWRQLANALEELQKGNPESQQQLLNRKWEQAVLLFDALQVDPERVSICLDAYGSGSVCWLPSAPNFDGVGIARKEPTRPNSSFGGWTTKRIREVWENARNQVLAEDAPLKLRGLYTGRIHFVDFDGVEGRLPLIEDLQSLIAKLENRGLRCRAQVFSSWSDSDKSPEAQEAKMHLYFLADASPANIDEWKKRGELIFELIETCISELRNEGIPKDRCKTLRPDTSSNQLARLARLPGFGKVGSQYSAVLYETDTEGVVNFGELSETRPVKVDMGKITYRFNGSVEKLTETDDGTQKTPLAADVWPIEIVQYVTTGTFGVRIRFHDIRGETRYCEVPAEAFANSGTRTERKSAEKLSQKGVKIFSGRGRQLIKAIGAWKDREIRSRSPGSFSSVASKPGWINDQREGLVYVHGDEVFGADWIGAGEQKNIRGATLGTVESWKQGMRQILKTDGLNFVLGLSFAAPIIGGLNNTENAGLEPFVVHLHGSSSVGKTIAAKLAASVWGRPEIGTNGGWIRTWDATKNALEVQAAQFFDGALLILDELSSAKPYHVEQFAKKISGGRGRERLQRSGKALQNSRTWELLGLSTGENSIRHYIDNDYQGGHSVRVPDLPIRSGDLTKGAEHARMIEEQIFQNFGKVGERWVVHLVEDCNWSRLEATRRKIAEEFRKDYSEGSNTSAEFGRIIDNFAVIGASMVEAQRAELWPFEGLNEATDGLEWALSRIREGRKGGQTPADRGLQLLRKIYMRNGSTRFPDHECEKEIRSSKNRIGFTEPKQTTTPSSERSSYIITAEKMLNSCDEIRAAGTNGRSILDTAREKDLAEPYRPEDEGTGAKAVPLQGARLRYWKIYINDLD